MKPIEHLIDRYNALKTERSGLEQQWREEAYYMRPVRQEFHQMYYTGQTEKAPESDPYITDGTAYLALDNFVGGVFSHLANPANRWLGLKSYDDDLNEFQPVKEWLGVVSQRALNSFGVEVSTFYNELPELIADTPCFGTGIHFTELKAGSRKIFDKVFSLAECYIDVNDMGEVDTMYRRCRFTPRQMEQKAFTLSPKAQTQLEKASQDKFECVHVVYPNSDHVPGRLGPQGFPFIDVYIAVEEKHQLGLSGRREFPYQVPRWSGTEKYGYGLGRRTLPDVKTINAMDRSFLEALEFQAGPMVLAGDEDTIETLRAVPRGVTYNAINARGQRMVDFLAPSGQLALTYEDLATRRQGLRDAWMFSLMQVMGRTGVAPIETLERTEERMRLMGASLSRMQNEFLTPAVARRIAILDRRGELPPSPPELAGQELKIEYVSPFAVAQRSQEAAAVLRYAESLTVLANLDPDARHDMNGLAAARLVREGFNVPASIANDPDEVQRRIQAERQAQMAASTAQLAEQGSKAAKNVGITVPAGGGGNA